MEGWFRRLGGIQFELRQRLQRMSDVEVYFRPPPDFADHACWQAVRVDTEIDTVEGVNYNPVT